MQFRNLIKKGINFTLVGVVGAIFDYGTRFILLHFGVPAFIARGSSYIVGSTVAYYLNSFFTFQGDRSAAEKRRAAISYILCFCTAVLVDLVARHMLADVPHMLTISWVLSQAAATLLNFTIQNVWVFQAGAEGDSEGSAEKQPTHTPQDTSGQ